MELRSTQPPTPAQLRALELISQGRVILCVGSDHFTTLAPAGSRVRTDLVGRVIRGGLAEIEPGPFPREVVLTPKGRRVLLEASA